MELTVLSWNLSDHELTDAYDERHDLQVSFVQQLSPDIVCLQKLSGQRQPAQLRNGFQALAQKLGMSGEIGVARGRRLHVAVLWTDRRHRIGSSIALGRVAHRNALITTLRSTIGSVLQVGSIHLPSASVAQRRQDVARLIGAVEPSMPLLLAGDWNSVSEHRDYDPDLAYRRLDRSIGQQLAEAGLVDAARHLAAPWQPTWRDPQGGPGVRIDAFRASQALLPHIEQYRVYANVDALSLHRPIAVRIAVPARRRRGEIYSWERPPMSRVGHAPATSPPRVASRCG